MRDDWPAVARTIVLHNVFDGIEGLPDRGIIDRMDMDLQAQIIDPAGGLRQGIALPQPHAPVIPESLRSCPLEWSCRPEQYGANSAPVSFSTTPSAKNFTVRAVSSGEPAARTRAMGSA